MIIDGPANFEELLSRCEKAGVRYIIVGGVAAVIHGSSRLTADLDIVYQRERGNLERLVSSLTGTHPYLRGAPPGLPFLWDVETLLRGLNFTLNCDLGAIDLLGEIVGGGQYEDLVAAAIPLTTFGVECLCLSKVQLIRAKRAAGRPKDLESIAELEEMLDEPGENEHLL